MTEKYLVDGKVFNVHPSQKEKFLIKYPNATLQAQETETIVDKETISDTVIEPLDTSVDSQTDKNLLDLANE